MSRQLTALEKYRITGAHDAKGQYAAFERLEIPATTRVSIGSRIIECVAHTNEVRACLSAAQWLEIRDENIDTAGSLLSLIQTTYDQDRKDNVIAHQNNTNSSKSVDECGLTGCVEQLRRRA